MAQQRPVTLILGMGPGLSAALADRFARGGHAVVGLARNPDKSGDLVSRLAAQGHHVELRAADAGDFDGLRTAIAAAERDAGPVEALVYNAYRASFAPPSAVRPEDAVDDFRVNVAGALAATQAVLPGMLGRGRGTVLFTGGGLALDPTGWLDAASLAVGKAGLRSLALTLNKELASKGVHVGTVTVAGAIQPGTAFAPERIAEAFWRMHQDPAGDKPAEVVFTGETDAASPAD
jgi:NAD(P)-dependent dehydrogenase (short-subunit alcohol dehydrogenase family)